MGSPCRRNQFQRRAGWKVKTKDGKIMLQSCKNKLYFSYYGSRDNTKSLNLQVLLKQIAPLGISISEQDRTTT